METINNSIITAEVLEWLQEVSTRNNIDIDKLKLRYQELYNISTISETYRNESVQTIIVSEIINERNSKEKKISQENGVLTINKVGVLKTYAVDKDGKPDKLVILYGFKIEVYTYVEEILQEFPTETMQFNKKSITEFKAKLLKIIPESDYIDMVQQIGKNKEGFKAKFKEEIPQESYALVANHTLKDYMMETFNLRFYGHENIKKLLIRIPFVFGIEGIEDAPHMHLYGEAQSGKSTILTNTRDFFPYENIIHVDGFSPTALFYANLKPNTVVVVNNFIFNDVYAEFLDKILDESSFLHGYTRKVTIEKEQKDLKIPPRILFFFSSNEAIMDYKYESGVSPVALTTKFITSEFTVTKDEKKKAFGVKIRRSKPENIVEIEARIKIIKGAMAIILANQVYIDNPFNEEDCYRMGVMSDKNKDGSRRGGKILTLAKCNALLEGRTEITESDVLETVELYRNIESKAELTPEENEIYFYILNDTTYTLRSLEAILKANKIYTKDYILRKMLESMYDKEILIKIDSKGKPTQYHRTDYVKGNILKREKPITEANNPEDMLINIPLDNPRSLFETKKEHTCCDCKGKFHQTERYQTRCQPCLDIFANKTTIEKISLNL